jgi:hypothetical protein
MAVTVCQLPDGEELVRFVRTGAEDRDPRRRGLDRAPDGSLVDPRLFRGDERRVSAMKRYPQNDWQPRRPLGDREREPEPLDPSGTRQRGNDRPERGPDVREDAPARRRAPREDEV